RFVSLSQCRLEIGGEPPVVRIPGFEPQLPDGAFVRGVPGGTLEEVIFHLNVLHALEAIGIPVYNDARAIERSVDKAMTSLLLARAGLPVPATWVVRDPMHAWSVMLKEHRAGDALVCKPLFGSQGEGVVRIGHGVPLPEGAAYNGVYYLQRYLDSGEGHWHDWRVFVVGGRALAAMRREGRSWVNNAAQGARCRPAVLDDSLRTLAEAAVAAVGMSYAGVDLLRDTAGSWWLIEVNSIPAWRALQGVCALDVSQALVDDFLRSMGSGARLEVVG
ncbi:MAG: RimK family alpha-L-glutamate ligase, partial [Gammaproteobacteria bacterium]